MKRFNLDKGREGEQRAVEFLLKKGYQIIERNWRTRFGEIDIVAKDKEVMVFVEVKTKTGNQFGEPWEMVNRHKLEQVRKMGEVYLAKNGLSDAAARVDVIGVWLNPTSRKASRDAVAKIEQWENVES